MASLPTQLSHLDLTELTFFGKSLLPNYPLEMPNLTTLKLTASNFEGHMQKYLSFPKLKSLYLDYVSFISLSDTRPMEEQDMETAQLFSDETFFRKIPDLELLSLRRMPLDAKLIASLQCCSRLREIVIDMCLVQGFIPSLTTSLEDSHSFPSLSTLTINYSWSDALSLPFTDFVKHYTSQRPGLFVLGNEKPYPKRPQPPV
jgi:hypothetical protein